MTSLHNGIDFDQYRTQAKDLLRAAQAGEPDALERLRTSHPEGDRLFAQPEIQLADTQLVIAREQGFKSWSQLKTHLLFLQAVQAIDAGDIETLTTLLDQHPGLVRAHATHGEWYEQGYFAGATLLHHIAGNPIRCPLPANILDITQVILSHGANPNTRAAGGSPIDLLLTSLQASKAGVAVSLIELLLSVGAKDNVLGDPDVLSQPLWNGGRATAEALVARGAKMDARHAAALGRLGVLPSLLGDHPSQQILEEALAYAVEQDEEEAIRYLIGRGAKGDVNASPGGKSSALHIAAGSGLTEIVALLLENGARADVIDTQWHGTPADWAEHGGHPEIAALIRTYQGTLETSANPIPADADMSSLLDEFGEQYRADPMTADRSLLQSALGHLQTQMAHDRIDTATAHAGYELLCRMKEHTILSDLLARYLKQPLTLDEEAWARWHQVDVYAISGEPLVTTHRAFLAWAEENLVGRSLTLAAQFPYHPITNSQEETLAPEALLLWVMGDGTQAECWKNTGHASEWLQIAEQIRVSAPITPRNQFRRFNFLRTMAAMYSWTGQSRDGLRIAKQIAAITDEEDTWESAQRWRVEGLYSEMRVYADIPDAPAVRRIGLQAIAQIDEYQQRLAPLTEAQVRQFGDFSHNVACPLRGTQHYDLAMPLFQQAIACRRASAWTYLYLAASIWATTQDRAETLELLRQASARREGGSVLPDILSSGLFPEFTPLLNDADFLAATQGYLPSPQIETVTR